MKRYLASSYSRLRDTNILSNFLNLSSIQLSNSILLMLIFPIITRIIGINAFGYVMLANTFAGLAGTVINYGINQSGVKDVALNKGDNKVLSAVFYNSLWIRVIILIIFFLFLWGMQWYHIKYYHLIILALPVTFAEVVNPLYFFLGVERLRLYNIANLISKVLSILCLVLFIKSDADAGWVNFILGGAAVITYVALLFYIIKKFNLSFHKPLKTELTAIAKSNFYLTANNVSNNLQQSIIIFALARWGTTAWLGAYSLCDKVIGSCRMLIITISNSVYPRSVYLFQQGMQAWQAYRRRTKLSITGVFLFGSVLIFLLADVIVYIISGQHNALAAFYLRTMAFVPTVAALNFMNVLDQILTGNNNNIFRIALILLVISIALAFLLLQSGHYYWIGSFTLIVEGCGFLMYEFTVHNSRLNIRYKQQMHKV